MKYFHVIVSRHNQIMFMYIDTNKSNTTIKIRNNNKGPFKKLCVCMIGWWELTDMKTIKRSKHIKDCIKASSNRIVNFWI